MTHAALNKHNKKKLLSQNGGRFRKFTYKALSQIPQSATKGKREYFMKPKVLSERKAIAATSSTGGLPAHMRGTFKSLANSQAQAFHRNKYLRALL